MKISGERGPGGIYEIDYNGEKFHFPSVTTILSRLKDPDVEDLRNKVGKESFDKISSNAAERGSVMHAYLENFARALMNTEDKEQSLLYTQKKTPNDKEFISTDSKIFEKGRNMFYNIFHSEFIDEIHKPLMIEGLMVSFKYEYAGRTDIIYVDKDMKIILGDYKTSSKILFPHSNKVVKYKLQLAAYINAFEEVYGKTIKEGVIWASTPETYQKFVLSKFEYPIYRDFFLELAKNFKN